MKGDFCANFKSYENLMIQLFFFDPHRVQFQFEEEPFDTVTDLITYYVGSGKFISAASGKKSLLFHNFCLKTFKFMIKRININNSITFKVHEYKRHAIESILYHIMRLNTVQFRTVRATQASVVPL